METPTSDTFLSDHIIKALCNTLMHSLWQGILLAILTGAIIIFTKKASAAYRYNLLVGALTLFAGGVVLTFMWQLQQPQRVHAPIAYQVNTSATAPVATQIAASVARQNTKESITETVVSYFNSHYNIIVLIWFLIICAKSVQMAVGLHGVYYLKRTKVFAVSEDWENRLLQLAEQLRIRQTICLMESGIAKVPMVIGHLKPVILIPIGLINSLPADAVEAILVHELAHIRRRDYLVNLLQSFIEIVFFFNPAVLWLSQLIKTERENCCDDMALAQSNNKENYIRALLSCEEYEAAGSNYAMAFPGNKNTLLGRVKRMVGNRNHSLNMFEKTMLAICVVALGLGVSAFTARKNITKAIKSVAAAIHNDVKAEHKEIVKAVKNDTTLKKQDNSANSTAALLAQLQKPTLSGTDTDESAGVSALKLITDKIDSAAGNRGTVQSQLAALAKLDTANYKKFHDIGLELYHERLVVDTNHLSISLNDRELIVNGVRMPEPVFERISRQFGTRGSYVQPYGNKYPDSNDPDIYGASGSRYNKSSADYQHQSEEQQRYWAGQQRKIIDEMMREGLIHDRTVSFTLTDKTFVINGLVQNGAVFQKYYREYAPANAGDGFNWNYNNNPGSYPTDAYRSRDWDAYSRQTAAERQQLQDETDKKLVADLLKDGLITDPNNVVFTLNDKGVTINGKKQSDEVYKKYKGKYTPDNTGSGWSWTYSHHE